MARLPVYLRALTTLADQGTITCSSEELASAAGVNSAKLRKDLSYLGSYGTRGVGYDVAYLRYQIARQIGVTQDWPVVCMTASANSKDRRCSRSMTSTSTAARSVGPASRQAGSAACAAATAASRSRCG